MTENDFRRVLKRQVLGFIKNADTQTEIGIPINVVKRHISNTRHYSYSDYPYDDRDVGAAIFELKGEGKVLCYRAKVEDLDSPAGASEEIRQRFPQIRLPSHVLLLKYVGE